MKATVRYVKRVCLKTGDWVEVPEFFLDGVRVSRRRWKKAVKDLGVPRQKAAGTGYPFACEALAVSPRQVAEANERNQRHGVNVRYDPRTGNAIVPDAGEYKKLRRLEGVHFNNAFDD